MGTDNESLIRSKKKFAARQICKATILANDQQPPVVVTFFYCQEIIGEWLAFRQEDSKIAAYGIHVIKVGSTQQLAAIRHFEPGPTELWIARSRMIQRLYLDDSNCELAYRIIMVANDE